MLMGMQIGKATVENSMAAPYKTESRATIRSCNLTPGHIPGENSNLKRCMHSNDNLIWCSRRTCTFVLLREHQNHNWLLNNHRQENVRSHQKIIPHIQRKNPNKIVGRTQSCLKSNFRHTRETRRVETKHCAHQDPGKRSSHFHKRLNQTCLWVFECLLWRHGSAVACHRDRGSGCRPGKHGLWHKSFWRRYWRRKWQPIPVFLPGESHGRRNLVACSPWGRTESDTTEAT